MMIVITITEESINSKNKKPQNAILKQEDEDDQTNFYISGLFVH